MKWIILAWGFWTRLYPTTKSVNKHLLPIYNKPMIYYPLETLIDSWINKIILITNPNNIEAFIKLLGSGEEFREKYNRPIQIVYAVQSEPTWIADWLWIARDFIGSDNCTLILGDNLFENSAEIKTTVKNFQSWASIFLKEVSDPHRFWIAEIDKNYNVISLEEKPKNPKSNYAVVWVYIYDNTCFQKCVDQPKSERWEYEITYINDLFRKENNLKATLITGKWLDTGTYDSMLEASNFIFNKIKNGN